jgi:hypothetical protein
MQGWVSQGKPNQDITWLRDEFLEDGTFSSDHIGFNLPRIRAILHHSPFRDL